MKTAIQCDFDGTVTVEDVSFLLLDHFADGNWRAILHDYQAGKITVGDFNTRAFAMVRADKPTLVDFVLKREEVRIRSGFRELLDYCAGHDIKFVIVSNGLAFYIEALLADMGAQNIEFHAARSRFNSNGMEVAYIGPDGRQMDAGFKEAHTARLKREGYRVIYAGNGMSDIYPARQSSHVFATGDLLELCRAEKLACTPFDDFKDVLQGLQKLPSG